MARHTSRLATVLLVLSLLISALPTQLPPALAPAPALAQTNRLPFSSPIRLDGDRQAAAAVALGDLDGDGALDIVLGNYDAPSQVFLSDGTGSFAAPGYLHNDSLSLTSVALGDLDGDGALDIVLGNNDMPSVVLLNDGTGQFPVARDINPDWGSTESVALGDLDGDGDLDIVLGNYDPSSSSPIPSQVYLNDGTGHFGAPSNLNLNKGSTGSVALGDLDGDGALDIVLGNIEYKYAYNPGRIRSGGATNGVPARAST